MPVSPKDEVLKIPGKTSLSCLFTWIGRKGDYTDAAVPKEFRGIKKYFNSYTIRGRANTVIATYVTVGLAAIVLWNRRSQKNKPVDESQ